MENNATMTKENQDIITGIMGVEPIYINSNLLTAQERKRLYWTNIPDIKQPEDKGIFLRDIVQPREEKKEYECYKRMMAKEEGTLAHKKAWSQVKTLDQKRQGCTAGKRIICKECRIKQRIKKCSLQKKCGVAGMDGGACLGFSYDGDDEPIERCKRCIACTSFDWEEEKERLKL